MPLSLFSLRLPVHPHQLEVQEFDSYELIVDLREDERYADDHLPGAVSVPWSAPVVPTGAENVESAPSSAPPTPTVDTVSVALPAALESHLAPLALGAPVLVYCDRGGVDSARVVAALKHRDHKADLLPGGWPSYRRWVAVHVPARVSRPCRRRTWISDALGPSAGAGSAAWSRWDRAGADDPLLSGGSAPSADEESVFIRVSSRHGAEERGLVGPLRTAACRGHRDGAVDAAN